MLLDDFLKRVTDVGRDCIRVQRADGRTIHDPNYRITEPELVLYDPAGYELRVKQITLEHTTGMTLYIYLEREP